MSTKNSGKQLTMDLVFTKTKSDSLHNIKNLNLWGNDLQDLGLIEKMPNLEVVSLSVNRISSLRDFAKCPKLQELYLRKNNITDLTEILHLTKLPNLKVLWLHDNPCAQADNYREIVIKHLPTLMKLDNNPVTPEDRLNAQKVTPFSQGFAASQHERSEEKSSHSLHNNSLFEQEPKLTQNKYIKNKSNYIPEEKVFKKAERERGERADRVEKSEREERYSGKNPSQVQGVPVQVKELQRQKGHPGHMRSSKQQYNQISRQVQRNQNIVMAILSLLQQLDSSSLEVVRRQTEKLLIN